MLIMSMTYSVIGVFFSLLILLNEKKNPSGDVKCIFVMHVHFKVCITGRRGFVFLSLGLNLYWFVMIWGWEWIH